MKLPKYVTHQGHQANLAGRGQQRGSHVYLNLQTGESFLVFPAEVESVGPLFSLVKLIDDSGTLGTIKFKLNSVIGNPPEVGSKGLLAFLGEDRNRPIAGAFWHLEPPVPDPAPRPMSATFRNSGYILNALPDGSLLIKENGQRERTLPASASQAALVAKLPKGAPVSFEVASLKGKPAAIEVRSLRVA